MADDLIYDVGMHRGEDTAYYLAKGFRVVAFEANPELVEICTRRFERELLEGRLTIEAGAIAPPEAGESVTFYRNEKTVWGTISPDWQERNRKLGKQSGTITLPRLDFAAALQRHGVPHYLKIDVEGVDQHILDVVQAASVTPDYLSIESEKVDFDILIAELDRLAALGYRRFRAVQQANVGGRHLPIATLTGGTVVHRFERDGSGPFADDLAQPWLSRDAVIAEYRRIFRRYRLFGDRSFLRQLPVIGQAVRLGSRFRPYPLPGWYDTHARRTAA